MMHTNAKNGKKKKSRKKMMAGGPAKKPAVPKMTMGSATRFINAEMKKTMGSKTKPSAGAIRMAEGILKAAGKMKYGSMTMPTKKKFGSKTMSRKKKK